MSIIAEFVDGRLPPDLYQAYLSPLFETWSDALVEIAEPSGRILDIASGTGIVSRKFARAPGVSHVSGIDVAPPMIAKAEALTPGGSPIDYRVASAGDLPFEDNAFNSAVCQQGLQFFPDKPRALQEASRVVAPGGRLTFAVWTYANDGNPVFGAFENIVADKLGDDLVPFGPFSFGDADALAKVADDAGLSIVSLNREERVTDLCDPRTLVLFDLLFLGRPGADGTLQPLFDPADASKDTIIEDLIAEFSSATTSFQDSDGTLRAPSTANVMVLEAR